VAVNYFEILAQNLPSGAEVSQDKPQSESQYPVNTALDSFL
jgi:hypothetical protein